MITIKYIEIKLLPAWMYETFNEDFIEHFKNILDFIEPIEYDKELFPHINIAIPLKDNDCNKVFEKYEEENDDILEEIFEMSRSDISNMKFTVDAKREEYYDSLEEE